MYLQNILVFMPKMHFHPPLIFTEAPKGSLSGFQGNSPTADLEDSCCGEQGLTVLSRRNSAQGVSTNPLSTTNYGQAQCYFPQATRLLSRCRMFPCVPRERARPHLLKQRAAQLPASKEINIEDINPSNARWLFPIKLFSVHFRFSPSIAQSFPSSKVAQICVIYTHQCLTQRILQRTMHRTFEVLFLPNEESLNHHLP